MPTYVFDDVFGDQRPGSNSPPPAYNPPSVGQWDNPPRGTCSGCAMNTNIKIPVDTSQVMNGTWHTVTVNPGEPITNVTITFTGTSVTAFCLLPPNLDSESITSQMNMTFELDGKAVGTYQRVASPTATTWTYNQNVFSTSGLQNTAHTFVISPQGQDGDPSQFPVNPYLFDSSFLPFDYITYDFEEQSSPPPPPQTSSSPSSVTPGQTTTPPPTSASAQTPTGTGTSTPTSTFTSPPGSTPTVPPSPTKGAKTTEAGPLPSPSDASSGSPEPAATGTSPAPITPSRISSHSSTAIIAGAAVAVVALILALLLWWAWKRRRAHRARRSFVGSATVCGTEDGRRPKSVTEPKRRPMSSRSRMSSPPRYNMLAPLTTATLERHEQMENMHSPVEASGGYLTTTPMDAQNRTNEGVTERASQVVASDSTNVQTIRRLEAETENLRAQRDELWLALEGQVGYDERSVSSFLPSYQDVIQSRRNDTILEIAP